MPIGIEPAFEDEGRQEYREKSVRIHVDDLFESVPEDSEVLMIEACDQPYDEERGSVREEGPLLGEFAYDPAHEDGDSQEEDSQ